MQQKKGEKAGIFFLVALFISYLKTEASCKNKSM
jgi:hypothetical protein